MRTYNGSYNMTATVLQPRFKEWTRQWLQARPDEELWQLLTDAKQSYAHVTDMQQAAASLLWEMRLENIKDELKRRASK